ncbi:hypothetical protein PCCS19_18610 [Paenibacillus sp. CCS19]|uniref:contact-dependent growth inhibition system immunity protein n=1 Tax=Paenibacillus sp. CCS19 TaxID=3158387 RepID=UPI00256118A4|nr:contact-dependent growth inhibition system immunity protein [Paenibacillus cellulosilyticus]GMK38807.1 hypothetical protein PCCS19_18610 [Paenibacillus cellulosilyticus]
MDVTSYKIKEIEVELGIIYDSSSSESPLSLWYENIRDKFVYELKLGDVLRLLRQQLYVSYIVPKAVEYLQANLFAGEQYDGELVAVLSRIPFDTWGQNETLKRDLQKIISSEYLNINQRIWTTDSFRSNFLKDYDKLLKNLY